MIIDKIEILNLTSILNLSFSANSYLPANRKNSIRPTEKVFSFRINSVIYLYFEVKIPVKKNV